MTTDIREKLIVMETLYSEQEYLLEQLNQIVTQQDQTIAYLCRELDDLKQQLHALKAQLPERVSDGIDDIPPHY